jgi:hypothetical protein
MDSPLKPGDAVKLTAKAARTFNNFHQSRVDWRTRRGIIQRISRCGALVVWEGRRTVDPVPLKGLTRALSVGSAQGINP